MAILVCMLALLAMSPDKRHKIGYSILILTFLVWAWFLYAMPHETTAGWLYIMPLVWFILIFRYAFPVTSPHHFPPQLSEPRDTQESLEGASGTREALTLYFLLLMIGLIGLLVMLSIIQRFT
jgi:hypothetical protein